MNELVDAPWRHADRAGEGVLRDVHGLDELLCEDLARMRIAFRHLALSGGIEGFRAFWLRLRLSRGRAAMLWWLMIRKKVAQTDWRAEMAANNAIEGNPLDAADWRLIADLEKRGLKGAKAVAFVIETAMSERLHKLDAAE